MAVPPEAATETEPLPLDLQQLRTFLAVHRSGSFTAGAQSLRLSQPTVTTQIRALERRLGYALFERLPRGVAPTAEANELAARISEPLDALEVVAGAGGGGAVPHRPLRLAGPAEMLQALVLPALAPSVESEGLRLWVRHGLSDTLLEELRAGRHDLVVSTERPRGRSLIAEPLADEEFVLVGAPLWAERVGTDRLARQGAPALCGVPLVAYDENLPILRRYWRHVFGVRLTCKASVTVPDLRAVISTVAGGAGISAVPRYLCQEELAAGRLVALAEPEDPPINTAYLVRRSGIRENGCLDRVRALLTAAARSW
ncbi:LysR family transcriptional regulator [Nocardiopsis lambiniae]|uniref:LysR family transcriptional regulator n=1 Tax=Nocardiopsis lambiniae TaxID=3075539 RepID=A0ABU2MDH6_9ACTN|nr:LysR family transcriptional regulator [Nocardiopsis sp. DSM 44743]MDT0330643.1 LysR family transcriptional regulator [Nocardiopsis sp. DSM 44743]